MVRASDFKSEDPGFDPLAEQGEVRVVVYPSESTLVQTCLGLISPPQSLLNVYGTYPHLMRTLRIPYLSVAKKNVVPAAGGMET